MRDKLFDLFDDSIKSGRDLLTSPPTTLSDMTGSSGADTGSLQPRSDISRQVVPKVDYSDFSNFVFFNSALDYFNISGERILNEYPYDGKLSDVVSFVSSSDGYQRYLLDVWPRWSGAGYFSSAVALSGSVMRGKALDFTNSNITGTQSDPQRSYLVNPRTGSMTFDWRMDWNPPVTGTAPGSDSRCRYFFSYQGVDSNGNQTDTYALYSRWTARDTLSPPGNGSGSSNVVQIVFFAYDGNSTYLGTTDTQAWVIGSLSASALSGSRHWMFSIDKETDPSAVTASLYVSQTGSNGFDVSAQPQLILRGILTGSRVYQNWMHTREEGIFSVGSGTLGTTASFSPNSQENLEAEVTEFRIWNGAKTPSDLTSFHNIRVYQSDDLLAYWRFDDKISGSQNNVAYGVDSSNGQPYILVKDYSGHKLDMMVEGFGSDSSSFWVSSDSRTNGFGMSPQDRGELILNVSDVNVREFVSDQQVSGTQYDRDNTTIITRFFPAQYVILEDQIQTNVLKNMLYLLGRQLDELKVKIDQFVYLFKANYGDYDQTPDALLSDALKFWGWTPRGSFLSTPAYQYFFGHGVITGSAQEYSNQQLDRELESIKNEFWKRTLIELPYIYKTKGTRESVESLLRVYGLDEKAIKLKEFGLRPNVEIQTNRINAQRSLYARRMTASNRPVTSSYFSVPSVKTSPTASYFFDSPSIDVYSVISSNNADFIDFKSNGGYVNTFEFDISFPAPDSTDMPVTTLSGTIFGFFSGTTNPNPIEHLSYTRTSGSSTGTLQFGESVDFVTTMMNDPIDLQGHGWNTPYDLPIFDGRWYHFTCARVYSASSSPAGTMTPHLFLMNIQSLDTDEISRDFGILNTDDNAGGAYSGDPVKTGSLWRVQIGKSRVNPSIPFLQSDNIPGGEFWIKNFRVWDHGLTKTEIDDHVLNSFSHGTDTPDRQSYMKFDWHFDQDIDTENSYVFDSSLNGVTGTLYSDATYDRFLVDYNFIAPPDYGWNEEKIRAIDGMKVPIGDGFADSGAISLEFNLIDELNQDISYMLSSMENWNNIIGDAANRYRDSYPELDSLRKQYFTRLQGRINFRVFADFLDFFDRSFLELIQRLIPARSSFKGAEFVVESHMLERPKIQYVYRRRDLDFQPEGRILIYSPYPSGTYPF